MSALPEVYRGVWINHARGSVYGSTLSLSDRDGTLFIAFLALFMNFVGNQIWVLISYILFHIRSQNTEQDGLYHQLQATLRNSVSSLSDAWKLLTLAYYWRGRARRVCRRVLPLAMCAILHCVGVGVVSIYAAPAVAASESLVLGRGPTCGDWNGSTAQEDHKIYHMRLQNSIQGWENSAEYARACYSSDLIEDQEPSNCPQRFRSGKPWSNRTDETCPFAEGLCKGGQVFSVDTGRLDSTLDFGINSLEEDRVVYRRKLTCSPLETEGFIEGPILAPANQSITGSPELWQNVSLWNYNYGKLLMNNERSVTNATFVFDNGWNRPSYTGDPGAPYVLSLAVFFPNETPAPTPYQTYETSWSQSTFIPIPHFQIWDGTITVLFLLSYVCLATPVDDPWFSSHRKVDVQPPLYCFDSNPPVSPLGCIEQHQFCNPMNGICTSLTSTNKFDSAKPDSTSNLTSGLLFNKRQEKVAERLFNASSKLGFHKAIKYLDSQRALTSGAYSLLGLPTNQWHIELEHWFGIVMAQMQRELLEWATGPGIAAGRKYITPPTNPDTAWMCENQIIHDNQYMCFSLLGLGLVLGLGGVIIFLAWFVHDVAGFAHKRFGFGRGSAYRRLEWRFDETFQLQRTALEASDCGIWRKDKRAVPVTKMKVGFRIPEGWGDTEPYYSR